MHSTITVPLQRTVVQNAHFGTHKCVSYEQIRLIHESKINLSQADKQFIKNLQKKMKTARRDCSELLSHGDPYGNRTHVTAVKGRCLNRLTNGPGSGNLIRTDDIPGMNRLLYQLSYAAMCGQMISAPPKSASSLYPQQPVLSRVFINFLKNM